MSEHKLPMLCWLNCKFAKRALLTRGTPPRTTEGGEA